MTNVVTGHPQSLRYAQRQPPFRGHEFLYYYIKFFIANNYLVSPERGGGIA